MLNYILTTFVNVIEILKFFSAFDYYVSYLAGSNFVSFFNNF